jgi:3-oxoacyl-[acyl-carrier protein] reductase
MPEDIAAAVSFLCGPGASFITGQNIQVNGGSFLG